MVKRCPWCEGNDLYIRYHDEEWGVPVYNDDRKQFEFLVLESAQAGLSWLTILKRRENYRIAYDQFDPEKVARFDEKKIRELLSDTGIIRNKRKVEASINNARQFLKVRDEYGSFCSYFWQFSDGKPIINRFQTVEEVPPNTALSDTISKDLKQRGFTFVGSTIIYSHLQAVGVVMDHITDCFRYKELSDSR